jgi:hypothetical protein
MNTTINVNEKSFLAKINVIHPGSKFMHIWENFHCVLIILCSFILPIDVVIEANFIDLYPVVFFVFIKFS